MRDSRDLVSVSKKQLGIAMLLGLCVAAACNPWHEQLVVSGDASCVGAEVRIDGRRVGQLHRVPNETEAVLASDVREWWGDEISGDTLWTRGDVRCEARVGSALGMHRVEVVSRDGRRVWDDMRVCEYNLVKVSFARMRIKCESECPGGTLWDGRLKQF